MTPDAISAVCDAVDGMAQRFDQRQRQSPAGASPASGSASARISREWRFVLESSSIAACTTKTTTNSRKQMVAT